MDQAKNFAKVLVDGGYDSDDTEITLITGHGSRLPAGAYNLTWWNATDYPDPSDDPVVEIVRVADRTSDVLTISRAQEGTAASDHNEAGKTYQMVASFTAKTMNDLQGIIDATPTGALLGDVGGVGNGTTVEVDDDNQTIGLTANVVVSMNGPFGSGLIQGSVSTPGTVIAKLAIHNSGGTLIGYLPIYDDIT